jgi:hypothetical protein
MDKENTVIKKATTTSSSSSSSVSSGNSSASNGYHCPFPSTEDTINKNDKLSTPRRLPLADKGNKTPLQSGPQRVLVKEKLLSSSASKILRISNSSSDVKRKDKSKGHYMQTTEAYRNSAITATPTTATKPTTTISPLVDTNTTNANATTPTASISNATPYTATTTTTPTTPNITTPKRPLNTASVTVTPKVYHYYYHHHYYHYYYYYYYHNYY